MYDPKNVLSSCSRHQWTILLTWFIFNSSMDKWIIIVIIIIIIIIIIVIIIIIISFNHYHIINFISMY